MANGRGIQLTRQIGEHLVTAELGRRGYVAAPFAGNVPTFDILAANASGHAVPVQVKAINGGAWQYNAATHLTIKIVGDVQKVMAKRSLPNPDVICILILLKGAKLEQDDFFIFKIRNLQDYTFKHYVSFLKDRRVRRPKNPQSTHCAIYPKDLAPFKNKWELVTTTLGE